MLSYDDVQDDICSGYILMNFILILNSIKMNIETVEMLFAWENNYVNDCIFVSCI